MRNLVRAEWDAARGRRGCGRCGRPWLTGCVLPAPFINNLAPPSRLTYCYTFPAPMPAPAEGTSLYMPRLGNTSIAIISELQVPTHGQKIHTYHRLSKSYLEHNIGDETDKYFPTTDCFKKSGSSTLTSVC